MGTDLEVFSGVIYLLPAVFFRGNDYPRSGANLPGVENTNSSPNGHIIPSIVISEITVGRDVDKSLTLALMVPEPEKR